MARLWKSLLVKFALVATLAMPELSATELHEIVYGARPYGMGNAYTAIANDEYSIFTNPAGIARARKNRSRKRMHLFKFPNLTVGSNGSLSSFQSLANGEQNAEQFVAETGDNESKPLWLNLSLYPVGVFEVGKNAGALGGYLSTRGFSFVDPDSPTNTYVELVVDAAAVLNMTVSNRTNRFNAGLTIRPIQRYAYEDTIPTTELADTALLQQRIQLDSLQMTGIGVDVGAMFTFADFWFPTIGIAALNLPTGCKENFLNPYSKKEETVCGNVYTPNRALSVSEDQKLSTIDPTDIRVGFSITPRLSRKVAMRLAFDMHNINAPIGTQNLGYSGVETLKLLHAGIELFAGNPLERNDWSVRAGYNQGYTTLGATIKFSLFAFEFATFGRDISDTSKKEEDRRFLGNFSIEF